MRTADSTSQRPLSRRLLPLAYALAAVIGLILVLTWGTLQVQVTLAGFLNGESLWSKAQKQAVIDLDAYAANGRPADLASYQSNAAVVAADRKARDAIASGHYVRSEVTQAFLDGHVMPAAIPGMIFMLDHFSKAPHMREAIQAWYSVDASLVELDRIAGQLRLAYADGGMPPAEIARQRERISELNRYIEPRSNLFSVQIALGATWLGRVLFSSVFVITSIASLLWLRMALRILASIRGTEERYRLLFDRAADAIVMVDEDSGRILDANRMAATLTGRAVRDLVDRRFADLFAPDHPLREPDSAVDALLDADGNVHPVEMQSSLVQWGTRTVRQAIIRDVSERVAMEQERRVAALALGSVAEGVIIADADRRVVTVNAAHEAITGYTAHGMQGRRFDELRSLPGGAPLPPTVWHALASGNWRGEVESRRFDDSTYPEQLSISTIRDAHDRVQYYVAVFTDVTTGKANQRRLEHLATHDPLTGLANRAEFERHCATIIADAASERRAAAMLFIDLDAFKVVNDTYSHAIGDSLLARVAERIVRQLGEGDVAGRIGGDEFTVATGRLASREDAEALAVRLLKVLAEPLAIGDHEIALSASIGIAGYPLDGEDATTLIANADVAMYAAKTEERNTFRYYTPMMQADARDRLQLVADLRHALAHDEFRLLYQPSIELRTGRIVAVEALLRWQHPERGEIQPDAFIPMAESLGVIRRIDEWVVDVACAQIRRWSQAGMPPIRVAVNVSAGWLSHPAFIESISRAIQVHQVPPHRLMLEITEGAILRLGEGTERTMMALHALGVGVAIDDFGTGYSSLAYLKLPAVGFLKIDRSFTHGLPDNSDDVAIIEAILAISKSLHLCAIAEGIETVMQHDFLLRAGCPEGQGYLYSRALEPAQIEHLLHPQPVSSPVKLRLVPPA